MVLRPHVEQVALDLHQVAGAAVFDLDAGPVTITLPDPGKRFLSMQVIDEDEYTPEVVYGAGVHTLSEDRIGARYVVVAVVAGFVATLLGVEATELPRNVLVAFTKAIGQLGAIKDRGEDIEDLAEAFLDSGVAKSEKAAVHRACEALGLDKHALEQVHRDGLEAINLWHHEFPILLAFADVLRDAARAAA